mmetsp:Transcript_69251/g.219137  ORF Transcript_69251/g.219137 Transcript_69251/m.219137 type:complete len:279 (+) Transcript_69251:452-1288(+)
MRSQLRWDTSALSPCLRTSVSCTHTNRASRHSAVWNAKAAASSPICPTGTIFSCLHMNAGTGESRPAFTDWAFFPMGTSCRKSPHITSWMPPKGRDWSPRMSLTARSSQSRNSPFTMPISSITRTLRPCHIFLFCLFLFHTRSFKYVGTPQPPRDVSVVPPTACAATPVGAQTATVCTSSPSLELEGCMMLMASRIFLRVKLLPVPATPVTKTCWPLRQASTARRCSPLRPSKTALRAGSSWTPPPSLPKEGTALEGTGPPAVLMIFLGLPPVSGLGP